MNNDENFPVKEDASERAWSSVVRTALTVGAIGLALTSQTISAAEPKQVTAGLGAQQESAGSMTTGQRVTRFTVAGAGSVNTWILEGPDGLVVIDFQRDLKSAQAAIKNVKAIGKPVKAMLLTHAHPDHIGGIESFKTAFPTASLYATKRTIDELRTDSHGYQKMTREIFKDNAPSSYPLPDIVLDDIDRLSVAGLQIDVREWGSGESESATMYYLPAIGALFTGDVVTNRMTDFLLEQRTGLWLAQLRELENAYTNVATVYPGHGASGPANELIRHSIEYLETFRSVVKTEALAGSWNGKELSVQGAKRVAQEIERMYPDQLPVAAIPKLLELNAGAVARELAESNEIPTK